jgi:pimeloyl-ACP methyl ester carboxylesterase
MPFFHALDGTSLFYTEWGSGEPILFLNSLGCTTRMWDYQFAALAEAGYRCLSFDRRGHGRSDQPAQGYDYDTLADDVASLIATLGLDRLTLVGHSMAGGEIVRYLTRHGAGRVARIVLIAPTTPRLMKDEDNPAGVARADWDALWARWKQDYPKWVDDNLAPFFVPETSRPMMQWGATLLQASLVVALACSRAVAEADFRRDMRGIEVPALLIHGDRDRSTPIAITGRPSAQLLPHCRFLTYEGAPHGLMFTHMDRLHADLLQFVRETS